jgi:hypothetical protein
VLAASLPGSRSLLSLAHLVAEVRLSIQPTHRLHASPLESSMHEPSFTSPWPSLAAERDGTSVAVHPEHLDSSGLKVLNDARLATERRNMALVLVAAPSCVRRLLDLTAMTDPFDIRAVSDRDCAPERYRPCRHLHRTRPVRPVGGARAARSAAPVSP